MDPHQNDGITLNDEQLGFDLLQEIENQTSDHIKQQRNHERLTIKAHVLLQPGNSSEFMNYKIQGITGDISVSGCQMMLPVPAKVGDIYRLSFQDELSQLPMVFGRCLRCKLVSEDAFEAGFSFFSPITLPSVVAVPSEMTSLI
ncbi:MAG: PilZ domain-containing protein [Phycisphaerae bacterium]|nr:PilZ domain-containing protein [Phycisphaerae bacterium]